MRKKFLMIWRRRPRLSRRGRVAVDLLVSALVVCLLWGAAGCPLPTMEMEFRRMERTHLLPRSEIIFADTKGTKVYSREGEDRSVSMHHPVYIGIAGERVTAAACDLAGRWTAETHPLEEGPIPAPFRYAHAVLFQPGIAEFMFPMMFVNVPEDTARGELSLALNYGETGYSWSGQGWDTGNGIWLFAVETSSNGYSDRWWAGVNYTLALYRADDSLLLERSGTL